MKKELEESLRHIQTHPSTGLAHNQQQISTQVETIFAIDELKEQIDKLNKSIEESGKQNQRLELSNYKLQQTMLVLTAITTGVVVFPLIQLFSKIIGPSLLNLAKATSTSVIIINSLLFFIPVVGALIVILLTFKYEKKFSETIRLKDSIDIVLKDKEGKIKEIRSVK